MLEIIDKLFPDDDILHIQLRTLKKIFVRVKCRNNFPVLATISRSLCKELMTGSMNYH